MTVSGAELVELRGQRGERRWGWLVIVLGLLLVLGSSASVGYWLTKASTPLVQYPPLPASPPELGGHGSPALFRGDLARSGAVPNGTLPDAPMDEAWVVDIGSPIAASPVVAEDLLYIGAEDGVLYALDAATGSVRWRFATGNAIASSAAIADGIVYFGSGDKRVYALEAQQGLYLWSFETLDNVAASPAVADGLVFVGSEDRTMVALDALSGALRWEFRTGDRIISSAAVADGGGRHHRIYFGSADGIVYALDAATGEVLWRTVTDGAVDSTPALSDGVLYVGSGDAHVYAIDAATGRVLWASETRAPVVASPAVGPDIVYVGDQGGRPHRGGWFFALRRSDGKWAWRAKTATLFTSSPLLAGDRVLFADVTSGLTVADAETGDLLFTQAVDGAVIGSPTWADGLLYIGTQAGKLYAFRTN